MRLHEIYQPTNIDSAEDFKSYILTHCRPWMQASMNTPFYRGFRNIHYGEVMTVRQDRRPKDTGELTTNWFNKIIAAAGGVANRTNSVFTSPGIGGAKNYGVVHEVYPIGDFHYTWSTNHSDWTFDFNWQTVHGTVDVLASYHTCQEVQRAARRLGLDYSDLEQDIQLQHKVNNLLFNDHSMGDVRLSQRFVDEIVINSDYVKKFVYCDRGLGFLVSDPRHAYREVMIHCERVLVLEPGIVKFDND